MREFIRPRFATATVESERYVAGSGGRFLRYEFLTAIFPSRKVNTSHPLTSTREPSARVPVNVHSDTPRSPQTK
jgi:thymidylate synthase ThyX